ncbi:MAG: hypothetical protein JSS40_01880 [Proteobacteria bacterium]|nr:hypothetical protein [Pseudomonadota bacterium]
MPGRRKGVLLACVLLAGAVASGTALAQRHHRGGPRVSLGFYVGAPFVAYPYYRPYYYAPYYYPPAYYPPVVVAPAAPPVYIEQEAQQAPQQAPAAGWWYYCSDPQGYYPYVKQCPGGWQQVSPQPPG